MSNIQMYWDGNVGAVEYDDRKASYISKPTIDIQFDTLSYSDDDSLAVKTLGGVAIDLTSDEIQKAREYANSIAKEVPASGADVSIEGHNNDATAHHDIRVALSNLHEVAHKVGSVWSTECALSEINNGSTYLPWKYVISDIHDCTNAGDETAWVSPATENYDITLRVGLEGLDTSVINSFKLELLVDDNVVAEGSKSFDTGTLGVPMLELKATDQIVTEGHKVHARVSTGSSKGYIVPSRTFLIVDNHGFVLGKRIADYYYNTLANLLFTNGNSAEIADEGVVSGKWNNTIVELN